MYDKLTKSDIEKMEQEIEYRKLVVRKEALEAVKEAGGNPPAFGVQVITRCTRLRRGSFSVSFQQNSASFP